MPVKENKCQVRRVEKDFSAISSIADELRKECGRIFDSWWGATRVLAKHSALEADNKGLVFPKKPAVAEIEYCIHSTAYDQVLKNYKKNHLVLMHLLKNTAELLAKLDFSIHSCRESEAVAVKTNGDAARELEKLNDMSERFLACESAKQRLEAERGDSSEKIEELNLKLSRLSERITEVESRYSLVCSAITPNKIISERYYRFNELVREDLLPLINRIDVLPNDAEQVMKIRAVDDELRLIESLKAFSERTIVAVAGGFSSGKSSFISSLFSNKDVCLPVGIEPVTAIPTYVFHADDLSINGYPADGGYFAIPQDMYSKLSHRFVEDFGFNLRDLLPFISIEVPMNSYKNLAFIDLPGYNPGARDGATSGDRSTSEEYITQAQALIWMIGLDSHGTVPRDDLDHLWELAESEIPIYIVLNKADLRPLTTLDEVLDQVADELMMAGISYAGICAYSSESGGELSYRGRSLLSVLEEWDQPRHAMDFIIAKIEEVISTYEEALSNDIEEKKKKSNLIKALELDLLELGAFEVIGSTGFNFEKYMSDESGGVEEDRSSDTRSGLVNSVREQIQSLRDDYRTKESERDLIYFRMIRKKLLNIMTDQKDEIDKGSGELQMVRQRLLMTMSRLCLKTRIC